MNWERDRVRLGHILEAAEAVAEDFATGKRDRTTRQAIERNIQIIGEACRVISPELQARYPGVPWGNIRGMRHFLVHEYYRVEKETVWHVAEHKIPALRNWIQGILGDLEKEMKG